MIKPLFIKAERVIKNHIYQYPLDMDMEFGVDWHVFDDHVCVDDNVMNINQGIFELSHAPVGTVRILKV